MKIKRTGQIWTTNTTLAALVEMDRGRLHPLGLPLAAPGLPQRPEPLMGRAPVQLACWPSSWRPARGWVVRCLRWAACAPVTERVNLTSSALFEARGWAGAIRTCKYVMPCSWCTLVHTLRPTSQSSCGGGGIRSFASRYFVICVFSHAYDYGSVWHGSDSIRSSSTPKLQVKLILHRVGAT